MSKLSGNTDFEYDLAVRQGNAKRIQTLIKNKAKPPNAIMLFALIRKHAELLPLLKEAGANPDDADGFNERALGHAVNYYPLDVVRTLLDLGADPNKESLHLLPLVNAASLDKIDYAKVLLASGADPNHPQWNGVTPLYAAIVNGDKQTVRFLLESGADPKLKAPDGKTLLDSAISLKRHDVVNLLKSFAKDSKTKSRIVTKRK